MGKKIIVPLISFLTLIIISCTYFIGSRVAFEKNQTLAKNGVIDLRASDFTAEANPILLDGVWEFYPNQFITTFDKSNEFSLFQIPNSWQKLASIDKKNSFGYGTFHLKILFDPKQSSQLFGLKVNSIRMAHRIFLNGNEVSSVGVPGTHISNYEPKDEAYSVFFQNNDTQLDIVIWVSNYDSMKLGGIIKPIYFGTQSQILTVQENFRLIESIIISMMFVIAISLIGGYLISRKLDFLYCGIYGLSIVVLFLTTGEKLIYRVLPFLSYSIFEKIHSTAILACMLFFLEYMVSIMPDIYNKKIVLIIRYSLSILIILCLFPFFQLIKIIEAYIWIGLILYFTYILQGIITVAFRRNLEAILYGMTFSSIFLGCLSYSPLLYFAGYYNYYIIMFSVFLFILTRAFLVIKKQKEEHQLVQLMTQELKQVNTFREELIIKTSSEFKSQFFRISSFLKHILEDDKENLSEESLNKLKFLIHSVERLNQVTATINEVVRIDVKEAEPSSETVNIKKLLEDIVHVCGFIYPELKCNINLIIPEQSIKVKGDTDKLIYIILNIFENALPNLYFGDINVNVIPKIKCIKIVVSTSSNDSLSTEMKHAVEENYLDMNDPFSENLSELGLGLTKKLVEELGGRIKCYSAWNYKEINLFLPMASSQDEVSSSKKLDKARVDQEIDANYLKYSNNGNETILIIDDDKENLNFLYHLLSRESYHIIIQSLNDEVFSMDSINSQIDLIIINLVITSAKSFDICKNIREQFSLIEMPILILTSPVSEKFIRFALKVGANDIIQKPINPEILKARIGSLLNIKTLSDSKQRYEMAFLHAQIKPHFLFNALNSLVNLCETDSLKASNLFIAIANFLRSTLNFSNADKLLPLEKELEITKAYLEIETSRFNNFSVEYLIDDVQEFFIPPLTIQILVENIIKHVVKTSTKKYIIMISIKKKEEDVVEIKIKDNGDGLTNEVISNLLEKPVKDGSIGIYNVNTRLKKFSNSKLEYITSEKGTTVLFYIRR